MTISACKTLQKSSSLGRAQIWQMNCARCHQLVSPDVYNDAQWDLVAMHMRVRAQLTPDEEKAIKEFLKAAN